MDASTQACKGWGIVFGIPALFFVAYLARPVIERLPLCAVRSFLGVECPGCGLSRSLSALAHGELRASIDFHPLGFVIALWLAYLFGRTVAQMALRKEIPMLLTQRSRDVLLGVFVLALIVQWVAKLAGG